MPKHPPLEVLQVREYLSPKQCSLLLGHSETFWVEAFDAKRLEGYTFGKRGARHILATSARSYLHTIGTQQRTAVQGQDQRARTLARKKAFQQQRECAGNGR
jgi:hypothetical protein